MPAVPYAKVLVSLDGGTRSSGGITASLNQVAQLSGENTALWGQVLWEIFEYPTGFALPSGWSNVNGSYQSAATTPASFTLSPWGKYLFRLTVNGGLLNGALSPSGSSQPLIDELSGISVASPNGFKETAYQEQNQFDPVRQWVGDQKANLRNIDASITTNATSASAAQSTANTAITNSAAAQSTANAAQTTANTGVTNAATAQSAANAAQTTANTGVTNAAAAQSTANTGVTNAAAAQSTANTASTNASTALITIRGQAATNDTPLTDYAWSWDGASWRARKKAHRDARTAGCALDGVTDDTANLQAFCNSLARGDHAVIKGPLKTTDTISCLTSGITFDFSTGSATGAVCQWFSFVKDLVGTGGTLGTLTSETFVSDATGNNVTGTQYVCTFVFTSATNIDSTWTGRHIWTWDSGNIANDGEWILRYVSSTGTGPYTHTVQLIAIDSSAESWTWVPVGTDTCSWRIARCAFDLRGRDLIIRGLSGFPAHTQELHHFIHFSEDDTNFTQPISGNSLEHCQFGTDFNGYLRFGATVAEEILPKTGSAHDSPLRVQNTVYTADIRVRPLVPNGYYYRASTPGTSAAGGDPAAWASTSARGQTNTDGTVTWTSVYDFAGYWAPLNADVFKWYNCTFVFCDSAGVLQGNHIGQCVSHKFADCGCSSQPHFWRARNWAHADFIGGVFGCFGALLVYGAGTRRTVIDHIFVEGVSKIVDYNGTAGGGGAVFLTHTHGNLNDPNFLGEMHPSGDLLTLGGQGPFTIEDNELQDPINALVDGHIQLTDGTNVGSSMIELKILGNNMFSKTRTRTGQKAKVVAARRAPFNLAGNTDLQVRATVDAGSTWFNSSITFAGASFRNGLAEARGDEIAKVLRTRAAARTNGTVYASNTIVRPESSIRKNSTAYALNTITFHAAYAGTTNYAFQCTTAGTSTTVEPPAMAAVTATGVVISDGSASWTSVLVPSVYFQVSTPGTSGNAIPALFATTTTTGVSVTDSGVTWTSILEWPAEIISATGGTGFGDGGALTLYSRGAGSAQSQIQVQGGAANTKFSFATTAFSGPAQTQMNIDTQGLVDCQATGSAKVHLVMDAPKIVDFTSTATVGLQSFNSLDNYYQGNAYDQAPFISSSRCSTITSGTGTPQRNLCALVTISGTATNGYAGFIGTQEADVNYQIIGQPIITAVTGSPTIPPYALATPLKNGVAVSIPTALGAGNSITYQVFVGRAKVPLVWTPASVTSATLVGDYDPDTLSIATGVINDSTQPWANSATGSNLCPSLMQATASGSAQPTVVAGPAGHNKVVFDGVAQFIQGATGTFGSGGTIATPYTKFTMAIIGKVLSGSATQTVAVASDIITANSNIGYQISTNRAMINGGAGGPGTPTIASGVTDPLHAHIFIARFGGGVSPFQGSFCYDGAPNSNAFQGNVVITQRSMIQPMMGKSASASTFTNMEVYRALIYNGWTTADDDQRLTDFARGNWALTNF